MIRCGKCSKQFPTRKNYDVKIDGKSVCDTCLDKRERETLKNLPFGESHVMYYKKGQTSWFDKVTNWNGSTQIRLNEDLVSYSRTNWGLDRYDGWFTIPESQHVFWVKHISGGWTDVAYVRRLKRMK